MSSLITLLVVLLYELCACLRFKLIGLLSACAIYQWVSHKVANWLHSRPDYAIKKVDQTAHPSVDIMMLSVTMIQTIQETHYTEQEMKMLLAQLVAEHERLTEKYDEEQAIQGQERRVLEETKFDLELKLRKIQHGNDYVDMEFTPALKELRGLDQLSHSTREQENYSKQSEVCNKIFKDFPEKPVDDSGDGINIIGNETNISTRGEGGNKVMEKDDNSEKALEDSKPTFLFGPSVKSKLDLINSID